MTDEKSHTEAAGAHDASQATSIRKNATCALSGPEKRSGGHLDPIEKIRATAGQFGHPADGGIVAADHSGDANKKVSDLIERMERIVRSEYAHRDVLIHNCDLGQITFGDVRDLCDAVRAIPAAQPAQDEAHPDDLAVDRFGAAMKAKLARKRVEGCGGWDGPDCNAEILSCLLRDHVEKGDPVDVGNLAMMLHQRGERIAAAAQDGEEAERLRAQLSEMSQRYTSACGIIDKLATERDALKAAEQVRADVELVTDADELRAELRRALAQIDSLEAECDRLHAQAEAAKNDVYRLAVAICGGEELAKLRTEVERLRKALGDEQDSADEMADVLSECGDGLMFGVDRLQAALDQHDALREAALRAHEQGEG